MQVILMPAEHQPQVVPSHLDPPEPVQVTEVVPAIDLPPLDLPAAPVAIDVVAPAAAATAAPQPVALAIPTADSGPARVDASQVDYLRRPEPRYPSAARRARLQGTVLLWVLIDLDGRPLEVRVHRSSGFELLDREGYAAVLHAMFRPYREHGVARMAEVIVPVEFSLGLRAAGPD